MKHRRPPWAGPGQKPGIPATADVLSAVQEFLIENDPLMAGWPQLSETDKQRERGFMTNSVRGFLGYLQGAPS